MSFQVFISFKNLDTQGNPTPDSRLAARVYEYLTARQLEVFYSNVSLERLGKAAYKKAIDDALDACSVLVAVGTSCAYFEAPWVRYEWDSFYNDILSGIRPQNQLFVYVDGGVSSIFHRESDATLWMVTQQEAEPKGNVLICLDPATMRWENWGKLSRTGSMVWLGEELYMASDGRIWKIALPEAPESVFQP